MRLHTRKKLPRHHQPVAAIVALAAHHNNALLRERRILALQKLHHALAGIFHQDDVGDAQLGRAPVHFAHLRRGQDLHVRTSASTCSSLLQVRGLAHHDQKVARLESRLPPAD